MMQAGSLLNPIYKYVLKMNFYANPADPHGTRLLRYSNIYFKTFTFINNAFRQKITFTKF